MSRNCVTHHYACDCREEKFKQYEAENKTLKGAIEAARVARDVEDMWIILDMALEQCKGVDDD